MSATAVIKVAQVVTADVLLDPERIRPGRELFATNALKLRQGAPLLIDHDRGRALGRVLELVQWPDTDGAWMFARCQLDHDWPGWVRRGTAASIGWANLGTQQQMPGGWTRVNDGALTEVSVLPPSVRPAEPLAQVVLLERTRVPSAGHVSEPADGTTHQPGILIRHQPGVLIRPGIGRVLGLR